MKNIILIIQGLIVFNISGQTNNLNLISLTIEPHVSVWLPLDNTSQDFKSNGGKIRTYVWTSTFGFNFLRNSNLSLRAGVVYKKINHTIFNKIALDPVYLDLRGKSNNLGIFFEPKFKIYSVNRKSGFLGAKTNIYFVEFYKGEYYDQNNKLSDKKPLAAKNANEISLASSSLELFYLHNFNLKSNFNLGVRASVGANVYSNWDQFKRYIWAGIGVEMSFGGNKKVE